MILAGLGGRSWQCARWGELTPEETDAAVAELREIAGGRTDILAIATAIEESLAEDSDLDGDKERTEIHRRSAALYRAAGADPDLIPEWLEKYRQQNRRDRARRAREQDSK